MLIDIVDEQVNTVGRAFLALPVGCARCHDHKFDPIPTADYYALAGILRSTETMSDAGAMRWLERPLAPEEAIARYEAAQKLVAEAQEKVDEVVREHNDVLRRPRRAALAEYLLAAEEAYPSWSDDEAMQERARETIARVARDQELEATIEIAWEEHLMRLGLKDEDDLAPSDFMLPREQEELRWLVYAGYFCILCLDQDEEEKLYPAEALDRLAELRAEVERLKEASPPEPPYAMAVDEGEVVDLPVHIRGSHLNLAEEPEPRGFLKVTDHLAPLPPVAADASGRLELARWITHPEHPLTARVIVNRVWRWHFGRGIVATPSNFGAIGSAPTHPQLLDWLARRFVEGGWSLKDLHRDIMLSSTYQLSTDYGAGNAAVDGENLLLWRMNRRRLEIEPIRDTLLQLAGRLDLTMGGRVAEYDPRGYVFGESGPLGKVDVYSAPRRSIYMPVVRTAIYRIFAGFDFGDASDSVGDRSATVVPRQALLMMNSPLVEEAARGFAERLLEIEDASASGRIDTGARLRAPRQRGRGRRQPRLSSRRCEALRR